MPWRFPGWGDVPVFWWMELGPILQKSSAMSSHVFGVYGFSTALGSLSTNVQGCVPVFLKSWPGAAGTGACCLLGGSLVLAWDGYFGKELLPIHVAWGQVFQIPESRLFPLLFRPYPYCSIKTSQATQHRRQNPRQTVKWICIKNTQRGSHTYKEREGEKKGKKIIKEGSKRRVIIKSDQ